MKNWFSNCYPLLYIYVSIVMRYAFAAILVGGLGIPGFYVRAQHDPKKKIVNSKGFYQERVDVNQNFIFFRGHVGPLHKIQGYQGHRNVSKCRPHHSGDICTTRGNNLFFIYGPKCYKNVYFGLFGGP